MIVKTVNGKIIAEAESVQDARELLAYTEKKRVGRPRKETKAKPKAKHKRACPICGKRVKYMASHNTVMHGKGRLLGAKYGDMASQVPITRFP